MLYSKEVYELVQDHRMVKQSAPTRRIVNADVYPFCLLNDGLNEICVDTTVEVKAGWEFT